MTISPIKLKDVAQFIHHNICTRVGVHLGIMSNDGINFHGEVHIHFLIRKVEYQTWVVHSFIY